MTPDASLLERLTPLVIAQLDGDIAPCDADELEALICGNEETRQLYLSLIRESVSLRYWSGGAGTPSDRSAPEVATSREPIQPTAEASVPYPTLAPMGAEGAAGSQWPVTGPTGTSHFTYFSSGWPVAYLVAAVILGIGLTGAALVHVSHPGQPSQFAGPSANSQSAIPAPSSVVARITGMVDCVWEGPGFRVQGSEAANQKSEIRNQHSLLHLGDRLALRSGLLEITYETGARVILQGPFTYKVESPAGGYLAIGKLTAKLEQRSEIRDQRSEPANQKSAIRHQKSFAVRTPTALVTDLGTEFGVEVTKSGETTSHVFRGSVQVQLTSRNGTVEGDPRVLHENESVRVSTDKLEKPAFVSVVPNARTFVRRLPGRIPIKLFSTGMGLKEGQPDPHWQLVAVSNDPSFTPRPAVVAKTVGGLWMSNTPKRSQWISAVGDASALPNDVTYTFRTRFDLTDVRPETARLRGWFVVDNHVRAMRLNGRPVDVPKHECDQFNFIHPFAINAGFVAGTNVLELDVENGPMPADLPNRAAVPTAANVLFQEDFETTNSVSDAPYPDDSGDYNPAGANADRWTVHENNPNAVQVTTSRSLPDPGAYRGTKYLRLRRAVYGKDQADVQAHFAPQTTPGERLCVTQMVYVPANAQAAAAAMQITLGNGNNYINLSGRDSITSYTDDGILHRTGIPVVPGRWQKWQIDYTVGASTCTLQVDDRRATGVPVNVVDRVDSVGYWAHFDAVQPVYVDDVVVRAEGGPMGLRVELEGSAKQEDRRNIPAEE